MKSCGNTKVLYGSFVLCLAAVIGWAQTPSGKEPSKDDTSAKARAEESRKIAKQVAESFELFLDDDRKTKLKLHSQPLLQFTNPVAGSLYADFFIWTNKGRPEVAVSVINWYSPWRRIGAEFQSLSLSKLTAARNGRDVWRPERAGIELGPIVGAPAPAKTASARLRQMRSLARDFTVKAHFKNRPPEGVVTLRLLSRPIYRYESTDPDLLDGALFAFARGTDSELLLLIEARRTKNAYRWEYALGRMNSVEFRVSHKNREVRRLPQLVPPFTNVQDRSKAYTIFPFLKLDRKLER